MEEFVSKKSEELTAHRAKIIIDTVGSNGIPPEWGFQYFTYGLDDYLNIIEREYLVDFINNGGSSFKIVIGSYGGGKTHFLYCIRDLAWKYNYVVSYVSLYKDECPFHKIDSVYSAIVKNLTPPLSSEELLQGYEKGLKVLLDKWFNELLLKFGNQLDSSFDELLERKLEFITRRINFFSFKNAVKNYIKAYKNEKYEDMTSLLQWLYAEGFINKLKEYGVVKKIDRSNAFSTIFNLISLIRNLEYKGIIILFDEAEQFPSLSSKQKQSVFNNLRELIDKCGQRELKNVMIFYALPDESIFDESGNVYEALRQRIKSIFSTYNPRGVMIKLEDLNVEPEDLLFNIGIKLAKIFEKANKFEFKDKLQLERAIKLLANEALEQRYSEISYRRYFVKASIKAFYQIKNIPDLIIDDEWAKNLILEELV